MHRQLMIAISFVVLLLGWLSAFLIKSISQQSDLFYLIPALFLGVGLGLMLKVLSAMRTAIVLVITAILAIIAINQVYPQGKVSVSGFFQRMQNNVQAGNAVTVLTDETNNLGPFSNARTLSSFADLEIRLFSLLPGPPRMMAFDKDRLFVSIPKLGAIYILEDDDRDGFADQPILFNAEMDRPHGLAWSGNSLFVAEPSRLIELKDTDKDNQADEVRVVLESLPDDGGHWTRSLAMGGDGQLYLSVGSRCNACEEKDKHRATVLKVDPETGRYEIYATGLRNTVGLSFASDGKTLWGSDNGRDGLGDGLPPDEINQLVEGGHYGWPNCYGNKQVDPELGDNNCRESLSSSVDLPAHSAPLGIAFGDGLNAPEEYQKSLYVAFHGSWDRSVPTGYKVVRIPFKDGQPTGQVKEFLFGWLGNNEAWGRPVAPVAGSDGYLYLSDDRTNAIYQIRWNGQE